MGHLAHRIEVTYTDGTVEVLSLTGEYFIHRGEVKKILEADFRDSSSGEYEYWTIYTEYDLGSDEDFE